MQQWKLSLRIEAARHGPAAGVTPVLIPVQHGSLESKKFVFVHLYIWPGFIEDKVSRLTYLTIVLKLSSCIVWKQSLAMSPAVDTFYSTYIP